MEGVAAGARLPINSGDALAATLEYLVPQLLAQWRGESLDGFYVSSAVRSDNRAAVLAGACAS